MDDFIPGVQKPAAFTPTFDIRPNRIVNLGEEETPESFSVKLFEVQDILDSAIRQKAKEVDTQFEQKTRPNPSVENLRQQQQANRDIEGVYQGIGGFFSKTTLAEIEQIGSAGNYEAKEKDGYQDLRAIFKNNPIYKSDKALEAKLFGKDPMLSGKFPGQGMTMPHNMTLLYGIGSDPFKKWDKENKETFLTDETYADLHTGSVSPRRILERLDPNFWQKVSRIKERTQNIRSSSLKQKKEENDETINFKNPSGADSLSWTDIPEIYEDVQVRDKNGKVTNSFDIHPNYYELVTSQLWRTMTQEDIFNFVTFAAEAKTRSFNVLRRLIGSAKTLVPTQTPTQEQDRENTPTAQDIDDTMIKSALGNFEKWWNSEGEKLDDTQMYPYGILANLAPAMTTMMDWGKWGEDVADNANAPNTTAKFQDKMVGDYLAQLELQYLPAFKGSRTLSESELGIGTEGQGTSLFKQLVQKRVITSAGTLDIGYSPELTSLGLDISKDQEATILSKLRSAAFGPFNIKDLDQMVINGSKRENVKVKSIDGQFRTVNEVIALINKGKTNQEKVENAQIAYSYFMDMFKSITGISSDSETGSNGQPVVTQVGQNFQTTIASDSEWLERNEDGQLIKKTGPLNYEFKNKEEIKTLQEKAQMLIALLEPIVSVFSSDKIGDQPYKFETLIDNSLDLDAEGNPINAYSASYRIDADVKFPNGLFKEEVWGTVGKTMNQKTLMKVATTMFGQSFILKMRTDEHKKKTKDYEEKLLAHKEEQAQEELRLKNKEIEDHNEAIKAENKRKEAENEIKKAEQQRAAEKEASR